VATAYRDALLAPLPVCSNVWQLESGYAMRLRGGNLKASRRVRKKRGVATNGKGVRRVVQMEKFWRFMRKTRACLRPGSIEKP